MHEHFFRREKNGVPYYHCDRLPVRHAFTSRAGGVSTGAYASLNFRSHCGDRAENVWQNYHILADTLSMSFDRMTLTKQVHRDEISVVTEETAGVGLTQPMAWESDAIITNVKDVPLVGFYADCVVTLLCDPQSGVIGVCHTGWRGMAMDLLGKTVDRMASELDAQRENVLAVMGPSIHVCCFETDSDVPTQMESQLGAQVRPFVHERGEKYDVDLQGVGRMVLTQAGVQQENIIDSGICTKCHHDEFWSHRVTGDARGVQAGVICL